MDDMYNNQNGGDFYQQPQYQYQQPNTELEEPITMGEWLITMLIMLIPCVNIVMMFVWAFSSKEKKSKSNYFKATLIFGAILLVFYVILFMVMGFSMASMSGY